MYMHNIVMYRTAGNTYTAGFFLEIIFRGDETKFSRNEEGQAKIHKIYVYVVHKLNTVSRLFLSLKNFHH